MKFIYLVTNGNCFDEFCQLQFVLIFRKIYGLLKHGKEK